MLLDLATTLNHLGRRARQEECATLAEEAAAAACDDELLAEAVGGRRNFYILSRGRHLDTVETCWRLICRPDMKKVYPSFPMSHVVGMPDVQAEIDRFRDVLMAADLTTVTRKTRGDDIDAACGQLAGRVVDRMRVRLGKKLIGVTVQA